MATCLGKSCSFGLPCVVLSIYVFISFPFGFEGRMWDLIVSVPDHCLSFYFWNKQTLAMIYSFLYLMENMITD